MERGWGGAGRLFEAGRLTTLLPLGWALIPVWALIRIITVILSLRKHPTFPQLISPQNGDWETSA